MLKSENYIFHHSGLDTLSYFLFILLPVKY